MATYTSTLQTVVFVVAMLFLGFPSIGFGYGYSNNPHVLFINTGPSKDRVPEAIYFAESFNPRDAQVIIFRDGQTYVHHAYATHVGETYVIYINDGLLKIRQIAGNNYSGEWFSDRYDPEKKSIPWSGLKK